jgi:excisionase family DNA binding protein
MEKDFLTLQEAAVLLGKSVQTVRRMIKKGDLKAQRIKTPQGFHYVVRHKDLGVEVFSDSTIQNDDRAEEKAEKESLVNQTEILTSQSAVEVHVEADDQVLDKKIDEKANGSVPVVMGEEVERVKCGGCEKCDEYEIRMRKVLDSQHEEKMALFRVLGKLQNELDIERRRPRSLLGYIMEWLLG